MFREFDVAVRMFCESVVDFRMFRKSVVDFLDSLRLLETLL